MISKINEISKNEKEQEVTIKLEKWQVERLLGAARLGLIAESWCANLWYSYFGWTDTHSGRWILSVGHTINKIKEQTSISVEDHEAASPRLIQDIEELVDKKCEELRIQKVGDIERLESTLSEISKEEKQVQSDATSISITDDMVREAQSVVGNIMAELEL